MVFFAAAFLVALRPERLTRWLGRLLCPCLLVLILVLFGGCLLHPLAGQYGTPTPEYTSGAVLQGVLYGYQTMDTLAALNFGAIIALNIQAQGITRQEEVQRNTILAGFVAGGCCWRCTPCWATPEPLPGPPSPPLPPEPTC